MTTVKRITDLSPYQAVLPYASELFGIYQPLLGWKSRRIAQRIQSGRESDRRSTLDKLTRQFSGSVRVATRDGDAIDIGVDRGALVAGKLRSFDSVVLDRVATALPSHDQLDPSVWPRVITADRLDSILKNDLPKAYAQSYAEMRKGARVPTGVGAGAMARFAPAAASVSDSNDSAAFQRQLLYESSVAGTLIFLTQSKAYDALEQMFYATRDTTDATQAMLRTVSNDDGPLAMFDLEHMDPRDIENLQGVVLSPIGVVHLFRQYFFELDTFLGTPEKHVWMSPGSTVELFEIHTRKTIVEKTLETALEILNTSESTTTTQDEISDAVKDDNSQDIKAGASVKGSYGSIEATSSFDYGNSQKQARETSHKRMRQQTDKLSSQIRRNFKSTFKTTTEVTDESSTRHLLANTTDRLLNYELRRKMRQVGVQVQDVGTYLCWQTYVDDPGRGLGLGSLIHIAKPPELDGIPHPEEIPPLPPFQEQRIVTIPFVSVDDTDADKDKVYVNGAESDPGMWDELFGEGRIQCDFNQEFVAPRSSYSLSDVEFDPQGKPVTVSRTGDIQHDGDRSRFTLHLDSANFQGQSSIQIQLTLHWSPSKEANDAIQQKNDETRAAFKEAERQAYEKAMIDAVKERVTLASKITSRSGDDLREEERIVVYRKLIQDMLLQGVPMPDDRTRHVVAEVLNAIFDVDKMLYFVAPEWWRPRLHRSRQQLQPQPPSDGTSGPLGLISDPVVSRGMLTRRPFRGLAGVLGVNGTNGSDGSGAGPLESSTVGWGGVSDRERDNYYITEDSEPAHFGSSLGWLLQLDGDSMRNAFLNAPWVKAVIPIRPGREAAAINWLKGVEGMNGIDDTVIYHASDPGERDLDGHPTDGQKMIDVLLNLARKIQQKYALGDTTSTFPKTDEVSDPGILDNENTVTSTPIDRVYEHGFFPLQGGFRSNVGKDYEIFDQWIEVLPTDQIVPVEVQYDPKTGRQL